MMHVGCAGSGSQAVVWAAFLALTALHVLANVRAMRALRLRSLNCARLNVLLAHCLAQVALACCTGILRCLTITRTSEGTGLGVCIWCVPGGQPREEGAEPRRGGGT